jgi:uncharacterized membrane protein YcaP (DUF421 family)
MYSGDNIDGNVQSMTAFDYITLVMASLVTGLSVVSAGLPHLPTVVAVAAAVPFTFLTAAVHWSVW